MSPQDQGKSENSYFLIIRTVTLPGVSNRIAAEEEKFCCGQWEGQKQDKKCNVMKVGRYRPWDEKALRDVKPVEMCVHAEESRAGNKGFTNCTLIKAEH